MLEGLLVVLALDDEFGVRKEVVATAVIGVEMGVDDVGDVGGLESHLGEPTFEPVFGFHPRQDRVDVLDAEAVVRIVDVRGMHAGVDEDVLAVVGADEIDGYRDVDQQAVVDPGREDGSFVNPNRAARDHVQPHQSRRNGPGQASILGIEKRAIVPKPSAGLHA